MRSEPLTQVWLDFTPAQCGTSWKRAVPFVLPKVLGAGILIQLGTDQDGFIVGYNPTFSSLNLTPGLSRFPLPFSLKIQCSQKRGS